MKEQEKNYLKLKKFFIDYQNKYKITPEKETYKIKGHETLIGRSDKDCPIILNYDGISRKHAKLTQTNNQYFIQDVGSTSGTFIKLQSKAQMVREKDIFELGRNEFQVESITFKNNFQQAEIILSVIDGMPNWKGTQQVL